MFSRTVISSLSKRSIIQGSKRLSISTRTIKNNKLLLKTIPSKIMTTPFSTFYNPSVSFFGSGAIVALTDDIKRHGYKSVLIVTDPGIIKTGLADKVTNLLEERGLNVTTYGNCKPNPAIENVEEGLNILSNSKSEVIVSIGGGSAHDNAKAIALVATNGGKIQDYEGLDKSKNPCLPLFAINTTAGTASEITRFTIISDEARKTKMAIIDSHVTPSIAVNDPEAMIVMPKGLTAATGLDALTHAIEAFVSTAATPITDCCALKAIDLIVDNLENAYINGKNIEARNNMCYAEYLAGMAFNNASLGYVHAIAHQLGGVYHLPHGVCNAVLLPHVQKFNLADKHANERLKIVAKHLKASEKTAEGAVKFIRDFADKLGIPKSLKEMGVKEEDFELLADNAMKDVCHVTNPIQFTKEEVIEVIKSAY